jgi:hypothetical protein
MLKSRFNVGGSGKRGPRRLASNAGGSAGQVLRLAHAATSSSVNGALSKVAYSKVKPWKEKKLTDKAKAASKRRTDEALRREGVMLKIIDEEAGNGMQNEWIRLTTLEGESYLGRTDKNACIMTDKEEVVGVSLRSDSERILKTIVISGNPEIKAAQSGFWHPKNETSSEDGQRHVNIIEYTKLGMFEDVERLMAVSRSDVNEQDVSGDCAVLCAAERNDLKIMKLLVNAGASLEVKGGGGLTPLGYARFNKSQEMIEYIEKKTQSSHQCKPR